MLDSGMGSNRGWQRNQNRTIEDFERDPMVSVEIPEDATTSKEIKYTISVYHYLTSSSLELDDLCEKYNKLKCEDWDSDIYGVSTRQRRWLERHNLVAGDSWNTYNHDSSLSQILQGTNMNLKGNESNFEFPDYVLLQVHGGCDARGGYTDAKLFRVNEYFPMEDVSGVIHRQDGSEVDVDNRYDGYSITDENGDTVAVDPKTDKVTLTL